MPAQITRPSHYTLGGNSTGLSKNAHNNPVQPETSSEQYHKYLTDKFL